ncbi:TonB-dependent receptor [Dyadobacter sp. CY323]|uniref:SusC/RagA family TonB-linked outer membrane protein n=1 Tax=Dyadobacter sp. CY323 TaxID=2907302 RepID=UPI001F2B0EF5|nr:TonB-dependent receptor [Dyadobacter sp. CY323]MCE6991215.1 TonB-dependent receptor [Dyadobacter sp. CY323]
MRKCFTTLLKLAKAPCLLVLLTLAYTPSWAQLTVTGKVTDETGQPVPGVNVVEKGTATGASTDVNGKYTTKVSSPTSVLVFSFVGYISQEVTVDNRTVIDVHVSPDDKLLGEVVVVGYGTQKKKDLTGSIASANLQAFKESPNVSILQSLKGALPGLTIGQTNQAGQEASINIRGVSTLNGNTSPLIIVDGLIFSGRLSDINPSDVASVDVLKDPSSKAIYGSQAANGVILVTTKSGKTNQKPSITYSGNYAVSSPTVNAKLLDRDAYLQKVRDINYYNSYTKESGYTQLNPGWDFINSDMNPPLLEGIAAGNNYDWYGNLTQPALISNHSLGVSGGSDKTTYFLSAGYTGEKGFIKNDNYKRYTARLNLDTEVTNWLTIGANTSGTFTDFSGDAPNVGTIAVTAPLVLPWDANGNFIINPVGDANNNAFLQSTNDNFETQSRLVGNVYGVVKIPGIKGLSYRLNFGNNVKFFKEFGSSIYGAGRTGSAFKNNAYQYEQTLDNILSYTKTIGKHNIGATAVYGYNTGKYERTAASGSGFTDLDLSYNNLALAEIRTIESSAWKESLLYQLASATYSYEGKYLLKATVRRDGFSGFSKNNKTAIFPSVGLGWVLSEEKFFNIPVINYLKIRGSYGENGNKVARYSSLAVVTAADSSKYIFGDNGTTQIGRTVKTLANNDLKWERTKGINIGMDFEILKNRIDGNIEYYNSNTYDLLWSKVLPQTSGFSTVLSNIGQLKNTGLEFMVHGAPVKGKNLSWDVTVNFSRNRNKVVSLLGDDLNNDGKEDDLIASGLFIGRSIGTIYDYQINGIYQVDEERPAGFEPGSHRVVDQNADGKFTPADDRVILGQAEPAYSFGIQNTVSYNQFTLRLFVNSIQGGKGGYLKANVPLSNLGSRGNATNSNWFDFYDYWSPRNPDAKYSTSWVGSPVGTAAKGYYQRNFVRLQDISLSYNFNKTVTDRLRMQNLKLFVSGKNLLTLTKWDGWDPETGVGIDSRNPYPVMKSYSFGLEVSF